MFKWLWKKKKSMDSAEVRLEKIKQLLFPPLELKESLDPNTGEKFYYHVDYSIDMNLESVLADLSGGYNDAATQKTISRIVDRLQSVKYMLDVESEIDKRAKYFVVDDPEVDKDIVPDEDLGIK